jgi:hypothetical protein
MTTRMPSRRELEEQARVFHDRDPAMTRQRTRIRYASDAESASNSTSPRPSSPFLAEAAGDR